MKLVEHILLLGNSVHLTDTILDYFGQSTNFAPSTGFSMGSKGEGQNRTVGLALCRGDVSATNCTGLY
ncbi:cysteine-rich repeat secretory protein 38-like [Quillaja saponaria]|uniref:Cysteine-rich repeat secretory protein 38-like n=1 Tax=Quillaja saponaria TaxID=32244 RepID=A0AAD7KYB6_QUISA|nr:cysteine-rich repeat secretory protein 38-like [Quillaja saponaria]